MDTVPYYRELRTLAILRKPNRRPETGMQPAAILKTPYIQSPDSGSFIIESQQKLLKLLNPKLQGPIT